MARRFLRASTKISFSIQSTNTSYPNQLNIQTQHEKEENCQCKDNKPILPFHSNFARQLHENEVMRRRTPVARENRIESQTEIASNRRPQQMEIAYNEQYPIEYIKQQTISNTPQQALKHSQQALQHLQQQALQHSQQQALQHSQQQALQYTRSLVIEHIPQTSQQALPYNET